MASLEERARESWRTRWQHQKSARSTKSRLERVVSVLGADLEMSELCTDDVERLVDSLEADGLADSTVNRHLAVLSGLVEDARRDGVAVGDHRLLYRSEPEGRLRWFSEEEVEGLYQAFLGFGPVKSDWARLIRFLAETGLRPSEALRLKWDDIDITAARCRVWRSKTGKARMVPLSRKAVRAVVDLVNCNTRKGPWYGDSIRGLQRAFQRAKWLVPGLAGDRSATLYCLRHTCASRLVEAGVHLRTVGEWLGHSSIRTTQRYAHVADELLESARDCLDALSGADKAQEKKA